MDSILSPQPAQQRAPARLLDIGLFGQFDACVGDFLSGHHVIHRLQPQGLAMEPLVAQLDGIVIRSPFKLDDACARAARRLKWIIRAGAGTDNISPAFRDNGVTVLTTPISAYSVAELVLGLTLGLLRNIRPGHESLRQGAWKKQALVGAELRARTVGILGYGRIGREISRLMAPFGTTLLAFDRSPATPDKLLAAQATGARLVPMDRVLAESDVVVACLPGSEQTRGLFDAGGLRKLRRGALLVNVGRGSLIDIAALTAALRSGHLAGAALDVFETEPPGSLPLFDMDNVLCTPHLGAQTRETHHAIGAGVIAHLQRFVPAAAH